MMVAAFIYTVWYVYKCNCVNSSSKKKTLLKFNENGVACFWTGTVAGRYTTSWGSNLRSLYKLWETLKVRLSWSTFCLV